MAAPTFQDWAGAREWAWDKYFNQKEEYPFVDSFAINGRSINFSKFKDFQEFIQWTYTMENLENDGDSGLMVSYGQYMGR